MFFCYLVSTAQQWNLIEHDTNAHLSIRTQALEPLSECRTQSLPSNFFLGNIEGKSQRPAHDFHRGDVWRDVESFFNWWCCFVAQKQRDFFFKNRFSEGKKSFFILLCIFSIWGFFFVFLDRKNDPAAGSPTATLLRLLLPLLKKCRWTFKQKQNFRLSDHLHCTIIGNNDGRCVQMAGT